MLGIDKGYAGRIRSDILHKDIWPSLDKMEEMLMKAGWKVEQEKIWGIAKNEAGAKGLQVVQDLEWKNKFKK